MEVKFLTVILAALFLVFNFTPVPAFATLTNQTSRVNATGNDTTRTYSYTFKIFNADDLDVIVRDTDGADTTLTKTTHYTVTGVGTSTGGTVVLVNGSFDWISSSGWLKTGYKISIRRKLDLTQTTSIRNQSNYYPSLHEDRFDKLTMMLLQHQDELDRSPRVPWGDTAPSLELPSVTDRASKFLAFDAAGSPIGSSGGIESVPVSSFMETVLDDTTASAARATLGFSATDGVINGVVPSSLGGTGLANNVDAKLGWGAHTIQFATTGLTSLTLPVSGTVISTFNFASNLASGFAANLVAPTVQRFTSGSGTYTTPTSPRSPVYIKVKMVGGGGGGGSSGTASFGNGTAGGNTTFGTSLLTANGGSGANGGGANGGLGGAATVNSPAVRIVASSGGQGGSSGANGNASPGTVSQMPGANGASTPFAGGGAGGGQGAGVGQVPPANSGAGGGGGAMGNAASSFSGSGGGAGAYIEAIIPSPGASYAYAVGANGTGGTAGTSGVAGGNGAAGQIIVEEYYQ
jgi:hypothetical protein